MLERSIAFHVCVRTRGTGLLARSLEHTKML